MIDFVSSKKFILPVVYVIIGVIVYNLIKLIINKISNNKHVDKKKKTIISLLKNIIKCLILVFVVLAILGVYGVDTKGIVASIGVAGVIVGLALQDTVANFLAGVLILFDNHYTIGDTVTIDGFTGEVVSVGLMTTKIRAANGEGLVIANSAFKKVINYSVNNTNHYINLDVSYDTDIDKLEKVLNEMKADVEKIDGYVGNYRLLGIQEFSSSSIKYMVAFECKSNIRFQAKRDFNMLVRKYFTKYKIEIPYTKVDVNIRGKDE